MGLLRPAIWLHGHISNVRDVAAGGPVGNPRATTAGHLSIGYSVILAQYWPVKGFPKIFKPPLSFHTGSLFYKQCLGCLWGPFRSPQIYILHGTYVLYP